MNSSLKSAFDEYNNLKKDKRKNYKSCYNSFLDYCDEFSEYGLKELFNNVITLHEIEQACKKYFLSSKKTESLEAINRFLSAIDLFYLEYLLPRGIKCEALEKGCRNKQVIKWICDRINQDLNHKIYLPLNEMEVEKTKKLINELNDNKFYTLGQKIIFMLFLNYGFKAQVIFDMLKQSLDLEKQTLVVCNDGENFIKLKLDNELTELFRNYDCIHKYPNRQYLFTNTKGKRLNFGSVLDSLKQKTLKQNINGINSTTIALKGVERLIIKGLTISEIRKLTSFEAQKIIDVSEYMMAGKDINEVLKIKLK